MLMCILIGLLLLQVPSAELAKNPQRGQQQTLAQTSPAITNDLPTEHSKDDAFKTEQLRQNRIIVKATIWIAVFGGLSFVAALIYAIVSIKQWKAIDKQAGYAGAQVEKMQWQLDAIKEQAALMRDSLVETRTLVAQNEMAVKAAERSIEVAQENIIYAQRAYLSVTGDDVTGNAFRLRIENSGNTPAAEVRVRAVADVGDTPPPVPTSADGLNNYRYVGPLAPRAYFEHEVRTAANLTADQQSLLADSEKEFRLWCSGVISYQDVFRKPRKTPFCLYKRGGNMRFEFWAEGNEAD